MSSDHPIVSREEWLAARLALLEQEKEVTRSRDRLSEQRRSLPWVRVDTGYVFQGEGGPESLADLFDGRSQLIVYHFMFHPDWEEGCKSCSFWADSYDGMIVHLNHRDATLVTISRAPIEKLAAFRKRMGWRFKWVSSYGNQFNRDFHVSFTPEEMESGQTEYNFKAAAFPAPEAPGVSVFYKDAHGAIFHTYSCYGRGLDILNGTYNYLDLTPKGRDEDGLSYTMEWVRLKDRY